jgi:hypothetical protein
MTLALTSIGSGARTLAPLTMTAQMETPEYPAGTNGPPPAG